MKEHTGAEIILRYLPYSTEIARKGGSLARDGEDTVLLDSGVVWLPGGAGHFIICLWGNRLEEIHSELTHKMGLMARAAYDYFLAKNKKTREPGPASPCRENTAGFFRPESGTSRTGDSAVRNAGGHW